VSDSTAERIEQRLRQRLDPLHVGIRDDSARHAGHPGASSGGGHYVVTVVSAAFEGLTLLEQHRLVNEALVDLIGDEIHALGLRTMTPASWSARH